MHDKIIKQINKEIEEYDFEKSKINFGDQAKTFDDLVPDELYIKKEEKKHFSKNIALWKQ